MPVHRSVGLLACLLAASWLAVHGAGGTTTVLPHLFYVPVIMAVIPFGLTGGIVVAILATLLCGPLMPLDVAAGIPQATANWLTRGAFFVAVGAVTGTALRTVTAGFEAELARLLQQEMRGLADATDSEYTEQQVREVLDQTLFHPVFQPIHDLETGELVALEALTRFSDTLAVRRPDVWFARAAEVGLGVELELAAARLALEAARELPAEVAVTLNASPEALADPRMLALLDAHAQRPRIIELTEHATVEDYADLQEIIVRMRRHGIRIAVDDAGAGFASLRHILRLGPDVIKLDISLTQNVRDDPVRRALASALVQFAHQTGTELIAEGIETTADLVAWQDLGAHAAQGHLLGRPARLPLPLGPCPVIPQRSVRRVAIAGRQLVDVSP